MIVSALDVTSCNPVSAPALTPRGHNQRVFLIPSKIGGRDPSRGPARIIGSEAILRLQIDPLIVAPNLVSASIKLCEYIKGPPCLSAF